MDFKEISNLYFIVYWQNYIFMFVGQYFSSIFLSVFTFSDDFEDEDVQLKYEKRGGEIWVSLDQYKLSSPSPEKLSSQLRMSISQISSNAG